MLYGCSSLTSLDLSNFNTSKVEGMNSMFLNCSSLTSLDLSSFDTSNVKDMSTMFLNCSSLTSLDLSTFSTSNVEDMRRMFDNCSSLTSLDLSTFDMSKVESTIYMFRGCEKLARIYAGSLFSYTHNGNEVKDSIGPAIVGGLGTKIEDVSLDDGSVNSSWIRPDVPGSPGLLTLKEPKTIAVTDVEALSLPAYEYTGDAVTPSVSLAHDGKSLVDGTDYKLSYENNVEPGMAGVIVEGVGAYSGYKRIPFAIEISGPKIDLSSTKVVLSQERYEYDGKVKRPGVAVSVDGALLVEGEDYDVAYSDNTNAGDAKVAVTGKGNFTGTATASFVIDPAPLSRATVSCLSTSHVYDGAEKRPKVTVDFGGRVLAEEKDYTLSYANNTEVGTARITVEGRGNYCDTVQVVFSIEPVSLSGAQVSVSQTSYDYDGSAKRPSVTVRMGGKTLVPDADYSVSYVDNVAVGTARAVVTGKGNYTGSRSVSFAIQQPTGGDGQTPGAPDTPSKPSNPDTPSTPNNPSKPSSPGSTVNPGVPSKPGQEGSQGGIPAAPAGSWKHDSAGWWYAYDKGGYPANVWANIDGKVYRFDASGYMLTGWIRVDGVWYYLDSSGARAEGWRYVGGEWYYLRPGSGAMATGWAQVGGTWYYLKSSGAMDHSGWLYNGGKWYWLESSGAMAEGWRYVGGEWYYLRPGSGAMATGWQQVGGTWYYLKPSGAMATGWQQVGGQWYWLESSGAMATGWKSIARTWYYLKPSGAMATGWAQVGGTWYYLKGSGAMATGWQQVGGSWYYLRSSGAMAVNTWVDGVYWVGSSGAMATSAWVDGGRYYVGADGVWQK